MHPDRAAALVVLWVAAVFLSVAPAGAQDSVFVAEDGLNTGGIGAYSVSYGPGSASGSTINSSLITTPAAGATTEVQMTLATDGLGDLFVGEWASGTTATVGEYSLSGAPINSSLLTLADSSGAPQLAADAEGHLFVAVGNTVSEYTTGGTLLNSFTVGPGGQFAGALNVSALALDSADDLYTAYTTGDPLQGRPYNGVIGKYTASGSALNTKLITTPNFINGLAVGGGNVFVSLQDGPPDIFSTIDEYTTDGTEVMNGFISNSGHMALDGQGYLLVGSYGDGTIAAYTTAGVLLNRTVVSGAGGAEDLVAFPTPEPSALALLAVGAAAFFVRRYRCQPHLPKTDSPAVSPRGFSVAASDGQPEGPGQIFPMSPVRVFESIA